MDLQTALLLANLISTIAGIGRVAIVFERRLTKLETNQDNQGKAIERLQERSA